MCAGDLIQERHLVETISSFLGRRLDSWEIICCYKRARAHTHTASFNKRWINSFLQTKFESPPLLDLGVADLFLCCLFK